MWQMPAKQSTPPPTRLRLSNRSQETSLSCFSTWELSEPAYWGSPPWRSPPPTLWQRHSKGRPALKASHNKPQDFIWSSQRLRFSESRYILLDWTPYARFFGQP